jgi:hypothetical protein
MTGALYGGTIPWWDEGRGRLGSTPGNHIPQDREAAMKKVLLLVAVLLAVSAPVATAGSVNIAWGTACYTENPVASTEFACDGNTSAGDRVMTAAL